MAKGAGHVVTHSDRVPGNRRNTKTDHLVESRLRLLFMFHDQARIKRRVPEVRGRLDALIGRTILEAK